MRTVWVLTALILLTALFLFCGGQKETTKIPDDVMDSLIPQREAEAEQIREPETTTTETREATAEEKTPTEDVIFFNIVHFDFDKYDLTPEAREILAGHAQILKDHSEINILIEGHCDERGTIEYNLALGERRAIAVKTYLMNYGIDVGRLYTISYGKERPLDPRQTEDAWAKNRRAAFEIIEE